MSRKRMMPYEKFGKPNDLLEWSKKTGNPLEVQRCLAIRMLMTGSSREDVMQMPGLQWTTLQKWLRLEGKKRSKLANLQEGRENCPGKLRIL